MAALILGALFSCDGKIAPLEPELPPVTDSEAQENLVTMTFSALKPAGLAWKAEIAAEIIAYTKKSIGQGINDAKYNMDTPTVFAWTLLIILFSILLELGTKKLLRRFK